MNLNNQKNILKRISKTLKRLGISPNKEGYHYLKDCILICLEKDELKVTKKIYLLLSKKYHKTTSSIEKAIRVAIENGWNNCDLSYSEDLFENTINYNKGKPTNYEFIATISEDIRLDL